MTVTQKMYRYSLLIFLLSFIFSLSYGQATLLGKITDKSGEPLIGAAIVFEELNKGVVTDVSGTYNINVEPGSYTVKISFVGYKSHVEMIRLSEKSQTLNLSLEEDANILSDVVVMGKSETTETMERPFTVSAIDVKPLKIQNLDINQILNTTTGVRIREEGGLGSNFNFSLNGFNGSQVKFFIDGIPMDYFGSSLSLNNIPSNLISKIEVYKGVVPVHLGSDALGGAINITTNRAIKNYLNVSYAFGSFNTHRASLIGRFTDKSGFVVNANAFFNYSDNNYTVDAEVVNIQTGKVTEEEVERFHDAYQSQTVQLEGGVENKSYADDLFLGLILSSNEKEIQSGYNLTKVVGEAFTTDKALISTLKYQKKDLLVNGLSLTVNSTYKYGESMRVDTSSRQYNWRGEYAVKDLDVRSGEISWDKTEFRFNDNALMASANISYTIDERQSIALNNTYSRYRRVGEDPISYNAVPFSEPNILTKNITGLSYSLDLVEGKLRSVLFGKLLYMDALTRDGEGTADDDVLVAINNKQTQYGFGAATTYFLSDNLQVKASYEHTYRLPEVLEMFGNGLQILSNPNLEAEKSQNFNIGLLGKKRFNRNYILIEAGYLYRLPENLIRNAALGQTSTYENLQSARAHIFEGVIKYTYNDWLNLEVNGTYQNIVNNQKYTSAGGENYLYEDRLPNMPFLFGNAKAGVIFNNVGSETGKLSVNWSTLFVEAFYLKWPSQGSQESKYDIPRQISHDLSASYAMQDGKYNLSLSCTNIMDSKLFDNFMLQKPGRAFNVKLSYFIQ
ncbi:TonB-dependent receptor [Fulvivirga sp. 29W222]|uniref:TonB-dependent receptor n=1 Tax=Fulvivirga marina TaxID=2494733 RepID=A0A937FZ97_9BACT|nr:TonB-dependent receptor [Fulvivirga marina]MBL6447718.1 TonB-dependent receptor [Fulvivirga marina]